MRNEDKHWTRNFSPLSFRLSFTPGFSMCLWVGQGEWEPIVTVCQFLSGSFFLTLLTCSVCVVHGLQFFQETSTSSGVGSSMGHNLYVSILELSPPWAAWKHLLQCWECFFPSSHLGGLCCCFSVFIASFTLHLVGFFWPFLNILHVMGTLQALAVVSLGKSLVPSHRVHPCNPLTAGTSSQSTPSDCCGEHQGRVYL